LAAVKDYSCSGRTVRHRHIDKCVVREDYYAALMDYDNLVKDVASEFQVGYPEWVGGGIHVIETSNRGEKKKRERTLRYAVFASRPRSLSLILDSNSIPQTSTRGVSKLGSALESSIVRFTPSHRIRIE